MALTRAAAVDLKKVLARKVVGLYRRMCREVPIIRTMYIIDETPAEIRHMVLLQFRKSSEATDPRIIDMLVTKGEMELEETRNQWKQRGHLMSLIKPELSAADPVLDFEEHLRRFLDGTLEDGVITRGYKKSELARLTRHLEAQIAAEGAASPSEPANSDLPWAQRESVKAAAQAALA